MIKKIVGLICLTLFMVGCDSLPDNVRKQAKKIPDEIQSAREGVANRVSSYETLQSSNDWAFLQTYAEREKWGKNFTEANSHLDRAQRLYDTEVVETLKRNESRDLDKIHKQMYRVRHALGDARNSSMVVSKRAKFLLEAKQNSSKWVAQARNEVSQIDYLIAGAVAFTSATIVDHLHKEADANMRLAALKKIQTDAKNALATSEAELRKVSSKNADYALLGDSTSFVTDSLDKLKVLQPQLKSKFDELYRDYSKVVIDRRDQYYIQIARATWCESDGCGDGDTYKYSPIMVSEEVFNYYDSYSGDLVAAHRRAGWFSDADVSLGVDRKMWQVLNLNIEERRSSSHNYAELWIHNAFPKYYLKYEVIENGKRSTTDWLEVSEAVFWANDGSSLGQMAESKPYGVYESEMSMHSVPPGMDRIAEPTMVNGVPTGSNQYGEWQQDPNTGTSFWHTYGQVRMGMDVANLLFGGNVYDYDDYRDYRHWKRSGAKGGYYGSRDQYGTYGYGTYHGNSRYKNTEFAKRNQSTVTEARNAGKSSRGAKANGGNNRDAGSNNRHKGPGSKGKT